MSTNIHPGYGAIPVNSAGAVGSSGLYMSSNGSKPVWSTSPTNAIQIGNPDPVLIFNVDGTIKSASGNTISVEDWMMTVKVMKKLIMEMSKDDEVAKKYPFVRDAAQDWLMEELKK
jgi:hypothetical protein